MKRLRLFNLSITFACALWTASFLTVEWYHGTDQWISLGNGNANWHEYFFATLNGQATSLSIHREKRFWHEYKKTYMCVLLKGKHSYGFLLRILEFQKRMRFWNPDHDPYFFSKSGFVFLSDRVEIYSLIAMDFLCLSYYLTIYHSPPILHQRTYSIVSL